MAKLDVREALMMKESQEEFPESEEDNKPLFIVISQLIEALESLDKSMHVLAGHLIHVSSREDHEPRAGGIPEINSGGSSPVVSTLAGATVHVLQMEQRMAMMIEDLEV